MVVASKLAESGLGDACSAFSLVVKFSCSLVCDILNKQKPTHKKGTLGAEHRS